MSRLMVQGVSATVVVAFPCSWTLGASECRVAGSMRCCHPQVALRRLALLLSHMNASNYSWGTCMRSLMQTYRAGLLD